jgi:hypothetical protein
MSNKQIKFDIHSIYLGVRDINKYNNIVNDVLFIKQAIINKCRNSKPGNVAKYININEKIDEYDYSQHCYKFNNLTQKYDRYNVRKLIYKNTFDLSEELDLTLEYIGTSWDMDFWLLLLPKFQIKPEQIDIELLNNLIAIHTECIRCINQNNRIDGKLLDSRWDSLDKFIDNMNSELEINDDGTIKYTDKLYNYFTILTSGDTSFFKNTEEFIIYTPLYNEPYHGNDYNLLKHIYKLFEEDQFKYAELIKILTHNFIKDRNPIGLKLAPKNRFTDPDNELTLTNKIMNLITTRSDKKYNSPMPYYMMINQMQSLLDYHTKHNKQVRTYEETMEYYNNVYEENKNEGGIEFRYLPNYQCTTLNAVAIGILSELYYGDRIKIKMNTSESTTEAFDKLITSAIKAIDVNFIGCDNPEIEQMFKFFNLAGGSKLKINPFISGSYVNIEAMERFKNKPQFRRWMFQNEMRINSYCWKHWVKIVNSKYDEE